jgi:hypothetical protein
VASARDLAQRVIQSPPGTLVDMELVRMNAFHDIQVRIGERSLNVFNSGRQNSTASSERTRVTDSIRTVIEQLQAQLNRLESRLAELDI